MPLCALNRVAFLCLGLNKLEKSYQVAIITYLCGTAIAELEGRLDMDQHCVSAIELAM